MGENLLESYNPLYDVHLRQYFALPHMQKHLRNLGLLDGAPVQQQQHQSNELQAGHMQMMDLMLRNRERVLRQLMDLQRKLDAAEKVELYRRIRSGMTNADELERSHVSRSLSRPARSAAVERLRRDSGGGQQQRRRRQSLSPEAGELIKRVENDYRSASAPFNPKSIYNRLAANVYKYQYLHKLDDRTLHKYMLSLRKQLAKLERFREVSFGPHTMAKHAPAQLQQSWFFRRRSLPSLNSNSNSQSANNPQLQTNAGRRSPKSGGSHKSRGGKSQSPIKFGAAADEPPTKQRRTSVSRTRMAQQQQRLPPLPKKRSFAASTVTRAQKPAEPRLPPTAVIRPTRKTPEHPPPQRRPPPVAKKAATPVGSRPASKGSVTPVAVQKPSSRADSGAAGMLPAIGAAAAAAAVGAGAALAAHALTNGGEEKEEEERESMASSPSVSLAASHTTTTDGGQAGGDSEWEGEQHQPMEVAVGGTETRPTPEPFLETAEKGELDEQFGAEEEEEEHTPREEVPMEEERTPSTGEQPMEANVEEEEGGEEQAMQEEEAPQEAEEPMAEGHDAQPEETGAEEHFMRESAPSPEEVHVETEQSPRADEEAIDERVDEALKEQLAREEQGELNYYGKENWTPREGVNEAQEEPELGSAREEAEPEIVASARSKRSIGDEEEVEHDEEYVHNEPAESVHSFDQGQPLDQNSPMAEEVERTAESMASRHSIGEAEHPEYGLESARSKRSVGQENEAAHFEAALESARTIERDHDAKAEERAELESRQSFGVQHDVAEHETAPEEEEPLIVQSGEESARSGAHSIGGVEQEAEPGLEVEAEQASPVPPPESARTGVQSAAGVEGEHGELHQTEQEEDQRHFSPEERAEKFALHSQTPVQIEITPSPDIANEEDEEQRPPSEEQRPPSSEGEGAPGESPEVDINGNAAEINDDAAHDVHQTEDEEEAHIDRSEEGVSLGGSPREEIAPVEETPREMEHPQEEEEHTSQEWRAKSQQLEQSPFEEAQHEQEVEDGERGIVRESESVHDQQVEGEPQAFSPEQYDQYDEIAHQKIEQDWEEPRAADHAAAEDYECPPEGCRLSTRNSLREANAATAGDNEEGLVGGEEVDQAERPERRISETGLDEEPAAAEEREGERESARFEPGEDEGLVESQGYEQERKASTPIAPSEGRASLVGSEHVPEGDRAEDGEQDAEPVASPKYDEESLRNWTRQEEEGALNYYGKPRSSSQSAESPHREHDHQLVNDQIVQFAPEEDEEEQQPHAAEEPEETVHQQPLESGADANSQPATRPATTETTAENTAVGYGEPGLLSQPSIEITPASEYGGSIEAVTSPQHHSSKTADFEQVQEEEQSPASMEHNHDEAETHHFGEVNHGYNANPLSNGGEEHGKDENENEIGGHAEENGHGIGGKMGEADEEDPEDETNERTSLLGDGGAAALKFSGGNGHVLTGRGETGSPDTEGADEEDGGSESSVVIHQTDGGQFQSVKLEEDGQKEH